MIPPSGLSVSLRPMITQASRLQTQAAPTGLTTELDHTYYKQPAPKGLKTVRLARAFFTASQNKDLSYP